MRKVYLLCGPSLAGKSTAAARIAQATQGAIVSADAINAERGLPFGGEGLPESTWAETLRIQLERLHAHLERGVPVIVDDTLCYRWLRDRFREESRKAGASTFLLVFAPPADEILRRHARLATSGARPVLSAERLADHLARFEWPGKDEQPVDLTEAGAFERFLGN